MASPAASTTFRGPARGKRKRRRVRRPGAASERSHRRATLPQRNPAVPSPKWGLTSVFGMGTGVAPTLWTVGKPMGWQAVSTTEYLSRPKGDTSALRVVKPHGRLVPVSSTRCRASTSGLSTSSSRTALQGTEVPGRSHLGVGFPLRCFQRLSLPHLATRPCRWRDNRYTIGASVPVLSY